MLGDCITGSGTEFGLLNTKVNAADMPFMFMFFKAVRRHVQQCQRLHAQKNNA